MGKKNDKPVYWDDEMEMFYWIEWIETGNNDIPRRHYIQVAKAKKQ
jgi:hypothetical protein